MALIFAPDSFVGLQNHDSRRILNKIEWLWDNRDVVQHLQLRGNLNGYFKKRLGEYRIIYYYDHDNDEMKILKVGHRDSIYTDAANELG